MVPVPQREYQIQLLSWLHGKVKDGLTALRRERGYNDFSKVQTFLEKGDLPYKTRAISRTSDNRLRKIAFETVGALTDVRPIWNYETFDQKYDTQSQILNKLARGWWRSSMADRALQNTLMYSLCGGSGYGYLHWNEMLPGGGDFELIPIDPRDVIPIGPVYTDSIQDWQGVIIRQRQNVETIRMMYPLKAGTLGRGISSWIDNVSGSSNERSGVLTTVWDMLAKNTSRNPATLTDQSDLYTIFLKDPGAFNTSADPILMGDPDHNWSYVVPSLASGKPEQECLLYPRGRMIVCTTDTICEDTPNPYWHGKFPLIRFTLEPLPWSLLGIPMLAEMLPLQHALNEGVRGLEDGMAQWIQPGLIGDRSAIAKPVFDSIDARRPGMKAYVNQNVGGEGFKKLEGPQFPPWYMNMLTYYKDEIDELSGVRGLQQMRSLKQMPSSDTLEKYMDAMSPMLRVRARMMEVALGELAELLKVGFFQYYDKARRMQILGTDGLSLEDYDYDPNSMVPADPELGNTRMERAQRHHKNFKFSVAPNTFLNISHTEQRMVLLQLFRANALDPWSLWKAMDIPDTGEMPAETVPDRMVAARRMGLIQGPPPEVVQTQNQMQYAQLMMQLVQLMQQLQQMGIQLPGMPPMPGMAPPGAPPGAPGGAPPQQGAPSNNGVGPQGGRPPQGGQPPQMVNKPNEGRAVTSESGR